MTRTSLFQRTLQFLSDFTGEISAQVYLPYRPSTMGAGIPPLAETSSIEDELRREIRALKGLVLNRYYLLTVIPKRLVLNNYFADDPSCLRFQGLQINL